jgi:flagella basal body P-ring formation protein FlgA
MQMPLLADVVLSQPVVMALRPIARGAVITAADVEVQQTENAPGVGGRRAPLHSVDELVGMEAGRAIQTGEIIFTDLVTAPLLVRRNEAVTVVAQGGGIRVHTTARARQDGARGDLIQVESLETKERFEARVTGLREASVFAPVSGPAQVTSANAGAAGSVDASPDANAFRRYQRQQPAPPRTDSNGNSTAFRKLINQNGKENVQSR